MLVDIRGQAPDKPGIVNTTPEITFRVKVVVF